MEVGARIRLRRKQLGISQAGLAAALDLSFQQVQKYERGANRVSASMLVRTAQRLDCSVSHLIGEHPGDLVEDPAFLALQQPGGRELLEAFVSLDPGRRRRLVGFAVAMTD